MKISFRRTAGLQCTHFANPPGRYRNQERHNIAATAPNARASELPVVKSDTAAPVGVALGVPWNPAPPVVLLGALDGDPPPVVFVVAVVLVVFALLRVVVWVMVLLLWPAVIVPLVGLLVLPVMVELEPELGRQVS